MRPRSPRRINQRLKRINQRLKRGKRSEERKRLKLKKTLLSRFLKRKLLKSRRGRLRR